MKKLTFYQRSPRQIQIDVAIDAGLESEIAIGDLTLGVYRFKRTNLRAHLSGIYHLDTPEEFIAVKVETFTDCMGTWRKLDAMRVFHKIERARLRDSDDLARLLVGCGLRQVPFAGHQYEPDHGEAEKARIRALHSPSSKSGA